MSEYLGLLLVQSLMPVEETETSASHPVHGVAFQTRSNPEDCNNVIKDERGLSEILRGDPLIYRTIFRIQVAVTEFTWKILSPLRVLGSVMSSVT